MSVFANELYQGLLSYGGRLNGISIDDPRLAQRFNELYWTVISQTDRVNKWQIDHNSLMSFGSEQQRGRRDQYCWLLPRLEGKLLLSFRDWEHENLKSRLA